MFCFDEAFFAHIVDLMDVSFAPCRLERTILHARKPRLYMKIADCLLQTAICEPHVSTQAKQFQLDLYTISNLAALKNYEHLRGYGPL